MANLTAKWLSMGVLTGPLALYSECRYRALPELPLSPLTFDLPALSVIIPARNEADNLRRLLPTLASAFYPGSLELIVIDDNSVDGTAQVARDLGPESSLSLAFLRAGPGKRMPATGERRLRAANGCFSPTPIPFTIVVARRRLLPMPEVKGLTA